MRFRTSPILLLALLPTLVLSRPTHHQSEKSSTNPPIHQPRTVDTSHTNHVSQSISPLSSPEDMIKAVEGLYILAKHHASRNAIVPSPTANELQIYEQVTKEWFPASLRLIFLNSNADFGDYSELDQSARSTVALYMLLTKHILPQTPSATKLATRLKGYLASGCKGTDMFCLQEAWKEYELHAKSILPPPLPLPKKDQDPDFNYPYRMLNKKCRHHLRTADTMSRTIPIIVTSTLYRLYSPSTFSGSFWQDILKCLDLEFIFVTLTPKAAPNYLKISSLIKDLLSEKSLAEVADDLKERQRKTKIFVSKDSLSRKLVDYAAFTMLQAKSMGGKYNPPSRKEKYAAMYIIEAIRKLYRVKERNPDPPKTTKRQRINSFKAIAPRSSTLAPVSTEQFSLRKQLPKRVNSAPVFHSDHGYHHSPHSSGHIDSSGHAGRVSSVPHAQGGSLLSIPTEEEKPFDLNDYLEFPSDEEKPFDMNDYLVFPSNE
ncbi:hypothetical protein BJ684DRAFT_21245 [Piptocephalis cylindrospora]|uniref:Uncharacterized protein n=1 Tax=Piptocephalis cylindrospora TaxID=1907219 RepID=A0A4P9Y304_9FUNG|nr:hypothetical protein BJ684DRAFT_21245 [Piptocephalis cylindrospora]|eukprot:RKP12200.1 hypothetical protein BJ684DRAFT_21245 [Piptocephalis cylindrospora]